VAAWSLRNLPPRAVSAVKVLVFLLALVPAARLGVGIYQAAVLGRDTLGTNPAEFVTRSLGDWALRFLLITLAVTPLRRVTGWAWLVRLRRMLGLFAFFYVLLHVSSYVSFDQLFDVHDIAHDIAKRPFITVGFLALLLLLPLAVTSTQGMVRRLGGRRWRLLHRLIYVIGPLAVLHFWWMVKRDLTEPIVYALILALLLAVRLARRAVDGTGRPAPASAARGLAPP
jgi:sulfoxide reductase heme-binding subunit YedZ